MVFAEGHERVVIRWLGSDHQQQGVRIRFGRPLVEVSNGRGQLRCITTGQSCCAGIRPENPKIGICRCQGISQTQGNRQQAQIFEAKGGAPAAAVTGREGCFDRFKQVGLRFEQIGGKRSRRSFSRGLSGVGHRSGGEEWSQLLRRRPGLRAAVVPGPDPTGRDQSRSPD